MNLRGGIEKNNFIMVGDTVIVSNLEHRPLMRVIDLQVNPDGTESATCIYFDSGFKTCMPKLPTFVLERIKVDKVSTSSGLYSFTNQGINLAEIMTPTLKGNLASQKKIEAIKEVRAITGFGLKEAKDYVEAIPDIIILQLQKEISGMIYTSQ